MASFALIQYHLAINVILVHNVHYELSKCYSIPYTDINNPVKHIFPLAWKIIENLF